MGGTSSISGNGVRWSGTNSRWLNQNNCISNVYYSSGNIYFTATGAKGNAKITLIDSTKDPDEIWTWTIWCTDQPGTISGFPSRVTANLSFTVMDRNLGAITATPGNTEEVYGLYYQWGHYIGFSMSEFENLSEETGYNMAYSYGYYPWKPMTKYSDTYWTFYPFGANDTNGVWGRLWGAGSMKYGIKGYAQAKKTMYDPCPPGYRVLPYDAVMGYNNPNSGVSYDSNGYGIYLNGNVFFPYNGNVYKGGATWMAPGSYVYVWTNIHVGANMGCMYYYVRSEGAGGIDYTVGHIISRGMGVRCVVGS